MKNIALFLVAIVFSAYINVPARADDLASGMQRVKKADFGEFYVKPNVSLKDYTWIKYQPLEMSQLTIDQKRVSIEERNWKITPEDIQSITKMFEQRIASYYEKPRNFKLSNEAHKNTLMVSFELLEFVPTASKDNSVERIQRSSIYTRGIGRLHAKAKIMDASTGELLAVLDDNRDVGNLQKLEENKRTRNERKLRLHFDAWISRLDATLSRL